MRHFLPNGKCETVCYRPGLSKHEIFSRFNTDGQVIFKSQWKNGVETRVLFNDDPDAIDYEPNQEEIQKSDASAMTLDEVLIKQKQMLQK